MAFTIILRFRFGWLMLFVGALILCPQPGTIAQSKADSLNRTASVSREDLEVLANILAGCPQTDKNCRSNFGADQLADWLKGSQWRALGRQGKDTLTFDDFASFQKAYGNALAQLLEAYVAEVRDKFKYWVLNSKKDAKPIIVDHIWRDPMSNAEQPDFFGMHNIPTQISVKKYAVMLSNAIDADGNRDGKLEVGEFIDFMISHRK